MSFYDVNQNRFDKYTPKEIRKSCMRAAIASRSACVLDYPNLNCEALVEKSLMNCRLDYFENVIESNESKKFF